MAADFRDAIERVRAERLPGALPYFPEGACRMTSRLFAQHLTNRPETGLVQPQLVSGILPSSEAGARHFWLEINGTVVDLTADPFGQPAVVVGPRTAFHDSLTSLAVEDAARAIASLSADERGRLARQLTAIESRLSGSASSLSSD